MSGNRWPQPEQRFSLRRYKQKWGNQLSIPDFGNMRAARSKEAANIGVRLGLNKEEFDKMRAYIDAIARETVSIKNRIRMAAKYSSERISSEELVSEITNLEQEIDEPILKKYIYEDVIPSLLKENNYYGENYINGGDIAKYFSI